MTSSRFKRRAVTVSEAQKLIEVNISQLMTETVSVVNSFNRVAASSIYAIMDLPPFDRSGLDGFAIRTEDQFHPLHVIGESAAGNSQIQTILPGTAVRIMTGSMLPEGADAVVMLEQTETFMENGQTYIRIKHAVNKSQNIARKGEEVSTEERLIDIGTRINAGHIAMLASQGISKLEVYRQPRVGILAIGNELQPVQGQLHSGQIYNSNSSMLSAQTIQYGGVPIDFGILPDDLEHARSRINEVLDEVDLLITSGGVSVGDYDIVAEMFRQDVHILFNKISMRPGSPTSAGMYKDKLWLALSGNPGACFVGFELIAALALQRIQGMNLSHSNRIFLAELGEDYTKGSPHPRYERGKVEIINGKAVVRPLRSTKSSMIVSIRETNALIVIPSGSKGPSKGEMVEVIPLPY